MSDLEILFFYYLIDSNDNVTGVLRVNTYLHEDLKFCGLGIKQVFESEHDTMKEFGIPGYTYNARANTFSYQ